MIEVSIRGYEGMLMGIYTSEEAFDAITQGEPFANPYIARIKLDDGAVVELTDIDESEIEFI